MKELSLALLHRLRDAARAIESRGLCARPKRNPLPDAVDAVAVHAVLRRSEGEGGHRGSAVGASMAAFPIVEDFLVFTCDGHDRMSIARAP